MAIHDRDSSQPSEGLRCPTCGARQGWSDTCRRCKSDLKLYRDALEEYQRHRRACLLELDDGRLETALSHARRCHELGPGSESYRLLALCQLIRGDWSEALHYARSVADEADDSNH